jgi:hypothetical protein
MFGVNTSILVHKFLGWKNVTKGLFKLHEKMKVSYLESIKKTCPSIQAPSSFHPHLKNVNMERKDKKPTGLWALASAPYGQFKPARVKIAKCSMKFPKNELRVDINKWWTLAQKKQTLVWEVLFAYFPTYHKLKSLRLKTLKPQCLLVLSQ